MHFPTQRTRGDWFFRPTMAWERPDQFSKVLSYVGSFTNIRGGHVYPTEKPIVSVTFASPDHVYLHVASGDKIFRRKTKAHGAL